MRSVRYIYFVEALQVDLWLQVYATLILLNPSTEALNGVDLDGFRMSLSFRAAPGACPFFEPAPVAPSPGPTHGHRVPGQSHIDVKSRFQHTVLTCTLYS